MNKNEIRTILELEEYLNMNSTEKTYQTMDNAKYVYYEFPDGTIAIRDYELAWIMAEDHVEIMWEGIAQDGSVENYLDEFDKASYIKDVDQLIEDILGFEYGDIISDHYGFTQHTTVIELYPERVDQVEVLVPNELEKVLEDEILYVDMSDYMDQYINDGLLFLYQGYDVNTDKSWTVQDLLEKIDNLAGENSQYRQLNCQFASIVDTVFGFVGDGEELPQYYHKFMDENGEPSYLMKEFLSEDWFQGLQLISDLEEPVLQDWFVDTYNAKWTPLDQQVNVTVNTYPYYELNLKSALRDMNQNGTNDYRIICDLLDKDRIIKDYIGVKRDGKWDTRKVKYNMYFDQDDFYETLIARAKEVLQPYIDNYPASLIFDVSDDSVLDQINVNEDKLVENEQESLMKDRSNLFESSFPIFLEWVGDPDMKKEEIGFFFVARP